MILVAVCLLLLLRAVSPQMTCGPKVSPRMIMDAPCDMSRESYCQVPGSAYPFSSVRRYIYENQGLMRRMYGDQRQSFVLRNEIDDVREKYDSLSFFDPAQTLRRPAFGPRSMDSGFHYVTRESEIPAPAPSAFPTAATPTTNATLAPVALPLNGTTVPQETASPVEADENATTTAESPPPASTESPSSTAPPLSSTTSSAPAEERNKFENKKGVNACPVKEEVIAPFWANNTRVSG